MRKWIPVLLSLGILLSLILLCACDSATNGEETLQLETEENNAEGTYKTEPFACSKGELTIRGEVYIPNGTSEKYPSVILSHGFGVTMAAVQEYADSLAQNGFVVVRFDFCGGSVMSSSDGETTEMSIFTEEEDLKAVFETVSNLEYVDSEEIYLMGTSQGGMVTAMAAADLLDQVDGIVLVCPAFCVADNARRDYASVENIPDVTKDYMRIMSVGRIYFEDLLDFDPYADVTRYTGPVLIVHGTEDIQVPYDYSVKATDEYKNAELVTVEGAGHRFVDETFDVAMMHIDRFLKNISTS